MAPGIGDGFRSFWHAMTSYDRHANHDSPYRTMSNNTHRPLGVGRNPPLDSVTSPGMESNPNLPYGDQDAASRSTTALAMNTNVYSPRSPPNGLTSPTTPYSPGMRSASISGPSDLPMAGGGIALQDFADGMPPAPPVAHSWERIETWAEDNYFELWEQLCTPATVNDINELEYQLDCSLPTDVRESIQVHDGQERLGMPTGVVFGCMLMDCEEILDEWKNWRTVEKEFLATSIGLKPGPAASSEAGPSSGAASQPRMELQARQDCQPEGSIQKVYSHPGWIPLVKDWGGNYLAVDLAPGPKGTWGQIILCGRDYDCKYLISKSWAHFLAMVADDLYSPHWSVDEESGELKLKDPRAPRSEPSYMEILRVRNERKFGRRRFRRPGSRPGSQPGSKPGSAPGSPHLSAMSPNGTTRGGLTRPPKEPSTLSDNHLKPPSKKGKHLRSVTEEPTVPAAAHSKSENEPIKEAAGSTLLDDAASEDPASNIQALTDVSLDDDKEPPKLKRSSTDLISHPPVAAVKRSSTIEV